MYQHMMHGRVTRIYTEVYMQLQASSLLISVSFWKPFAFLRVLTARRKRTPGEAGKNNKKTSECLISLSLIGESLMPIFMHTASLSELRRCYLIVPFKGHRTDDLHSSHCNIQKDVLRENMGGALERYGKREELHACMDAPSQCWLRTVTQAESGVYTPENRVPTQQHHHIVAVLGLGGRIQRRLSEIESPSDKRFFEHDTHSPKVYVHRTFP